MKTPVDDVSPFGTYTPGYIRCRFHRATNETYKAGWLGRRIFGRLRWLERHLWSANEGILDVERFGLRWRLYQRGNVADSRLLLRPDRFEPTEIRAVLDFLAPNFTFIDVGANCGFYSLRVAHDIARLGGGRVIAIEPHPEVLRRLAFNVSINHSSTVRILSCAIGDRNGTATLLEGQRNLGQTRVSDTGSIKVAICTLLDIVEKECLNRIDAIKVDVEGFEDRVLDPFFRDAPESLLPRLVVAEQLWSDSWQCNWLARAAFRGYRQIVRTRGGNIILTRQ